MCGVVRSKGGKPIIAIPATAKNGQYSRIVPSLAEGAGVTTSRGDVHYVVTEYGVADLYGRTIRERARALMDIAHPKFQEDLERYCLEQRYFFFPRNAAAKKDEQVTSTPTSIVDLY